MHTNSYISTAALAAALLATPQASLAQDLGLNLDLGVLGVGVDADVNVGGESLLGVDADVTTGSTGSSGSGNSLVDLDVDVGSRTGPNGGTLIDLGGNGSDTALVDADIDLPGRTSGGTALVTGDVRIGALASGNRSEALLGLIDSPNLANIDLDAAIDDRRVAIVAAADLLGSEDLADIRAAIETGGPGRTELRDALNASVELGAILGNGGIDLDDVLAVQVAENGATEVIVLDDAVEVALLGRGGNLADLSVGDLATLDLDLLSDDELAALDLDLLPDELAAAVELRLLGNDGNLADLSIGDLADLDIDLLPGGGDDGNGGGTPPGGNPGGGEGGTPGSPGSGGNGSDSDGPTVIGTLPPTTIGASFGVAALDCQIGVLALASGLDATPRAIAGARTLELVRIEGCQRSLVDAEVATIRAAISANPAIIAALQQASIPLDEVIGATIQGGTLTIFIDPVIV